MQSNSSIRCPSPSPPQNVYTISKQNEINTNKMNNTGAYCFRWSLLVFPQAAFSGYGLYSPSACDPQTLLSASCVPDAYLWRRRRRMVLCLPSKSSLGDRETYKQRVPIKSTPCNPRNRPRITWKSQAGTPHSAYTVKDRLSGGGFLELGETAWVRGCQARDGGRARPSRCMNRTPQITKNNSN